MIHFTPFGGSALLNPHSKSLFTSSLFLAVARCSGASPITDIQILLSKEPLLPGMSFRGILLLFSTITDFFGLYIHSFSFVSTFDTRSCPFAACLLGYVKLHPSLSSGHYLCYRKGDDSPPLVDIVIVHEDEERLEFCPASYWKLGRSLSVPPSTFLCWKKGGHEIHQILFFCTIPFC